MNELFYIKRFFIIAICILFISLFIKQFIEYINKTTNAFDNTKYIKKSEKVYETIKLFHENKFLIFILGLLFVLMFGFVIYILSKPTNIKIPKYEFTIPKIELPEIKIYSEVKMEFNNFEKFMMFLCFLLSSTYFVKLHFEDDEITKYLYNTNSVLLSIVVIYIVIMLSVLNKENIKKYLYSLINKN
jgi:hypothetical protein